MNRQELSSFNVSPYCLQYLAGIKEEFRSLLIAAGINEEHLEIRENFENFRNGKMAGVDGIDEIYWMLKNRATRISIEVENFIDPQALVLVFEERINEKAVCKKSLRVDELFSEPCIQACIGWMELGELTVWNENDKV